MTFLSLIHAVVALAISHELYLKGVLELPAEMVTLACPVKKK
jgi:hypothetical protein